MSLPSFTLSKRGAKWIAVADVGFKKPVEVDCGDGSRQAAEQIAKKEIKRKYHLAEAGRIRWRKERADRISFNAYKEARDKGTAAPAAPAAATKPDPPPEDPDPPTLSDEDNNSPAPAADPEVPTTPAPDSSRTEAIAAKLRGLGESDRPIEPDAIHRPGEIPDGAGDAGDAGDAPMDNEAGELLADILAAAAVVGHVKLVAKYLKRRKPPRRPGEPNEKMLEWERDGLAYNLARLFGKTTTMGPTAKMFVGAGFMTIGMLIDSEPLEAAAGTPPPAAASSPGATPATPDASAATSEDKPTDSGPPQTSIALGRF